MSCWDRGWGWGAGRGRNSALPAPVLSLKQRWPPWTDVWVSSPPTVTRAVTGLVEACHLMVGLGVRGRDSQGRDCGPRGLPILSRPHSRPCPRLPRWLPGGPLLRGGSNCDPEGSSCGSPSSQMKLRVCGRPRGRLSPAGLKVTPIFSRFLRFGEVNPSKRPWPFF